MVINQVHMQCACNNADPSAVVLDGIGVACDMAAPNGQHTTAGALVWRKVLPAGERIEGLDGRWWTVPNVHELVDAMNARLKIIETPTDENHSLQLAAPNGAPSPSFGRIEQYRVAADGGVEGLIELNAAGAEAINNKSYMYLSPVILFSSKDPQRRIQGIESVAFVNRPNFILSALNARKQPPTKKGTPEMKEFLIKMLGLGADATDADIQAALNSRLGDAASVRAALKLKQDAPHTDVEAALNALQTQAATATAGAQPSVPSLDSYVPRADYDAAVARALNAEQKLVGDLNKRLDAALNAATQAKVIEPASRDFYHAQALGDDGQIHPDRLANLEAELNRRRPLMTPGVATGAKAPDAAGLNALTDDERAMCRAFGTKEEDYIAARNARAAAAQGGA